MGLSMFDLPAWLWLQSLVQGVTEFLPVSSTGHLGLGWALFERFGIDVPSEQEQQLIDIALHVGTLLAVLIYFARDMVQLAAGGLALFLRQEGSRQDPRTHLFLVVFVASMPILLLGAFPLTAEIRELIKNNLSLIAATTILFGILLWIADRFFWATAKVRNLSLLGALFIGAMQCLALIPGVSRSGITITAGRFLGLEREGATRFAMLLSVPAILGAGASGMLKLIATGSLALTGQIIMAATLAFLAAMAAIHILMELSRRASYTFFVLYRLALGLLIYAFLIFDGQLATG